MSGLRTPELENTIIEGLSEGIPLRELARTYGFGKSSFYVWLEEDEAFAGRIARARDIGFDAIAEETLEIADDGTNDWITRHRDDGSTDDVVNSEHIQRSRLRVDTRLKLLAKWAPKKYGEKLDLNHIGGVDHNVKLVDMSDDELLKLAAADRPC